MHLSIRSFEMDFYAATVIGAGLAAIGIGIAAGGVGNVFGSYLEGAMRNPAAADSQRQYMFIGFAAAELLGLMALTVAILILFVVKPPAAAEAAAAPAVVEAAAAPGAAPAKN
jgi:F-type H+-transporting ATPase subunit c